MTEAATETLSVVVERELPFPTDRIWRALTQPHLISEWLMQNDFKPELGHQFSLSGEWGAVACKVREIVPQTSLAYSWDGFGLESVVTWTLTPTDGGTHLRMEQRGFRPEQRQFFQGAKASWPQFFSNLESVLDRID